MGAVLDVATAEGKRESTRLSSAQKIALVVLRTVMGWRFLYEGYYKLALPGWSSAGVPLGRWSSAGYFKSASGPVARVFQRLTDAGWGGWIDNTVKIALLLIGLSLILGIFTRAGAWGAIILLTLFYVTAIPLSGIQAPGSEGAYLIVNKTLLEGVAAVVVLVFNTGEIAGLDLLRKGSRKAFGLHKGNARGEAPFPTSTVPSQSGDLGVR